MRAPGIADVLKHRTFRLLAVGIAMSRTGDAMTFVVIAWLALNLGGPRAVGMVVFIGGVVTTLSGPVLGYLMDRLGIRLLMLTDNIARGVLMLTMAVLVHLDQAQLWHLLVFAGISALLSPATELGQSVAVPEMLESDELDAANRLLAASWDVAAWIGPVVAGVGIDLVGPAAVLVVDASTFFVMALVALALPGRRSHTDPEPKTVAGRLLSGFVLLWRLRPVMILTLVTVMYLFLGAMMEVFLPAFTLLTLNESATVYGALVSLAGAASLLGTLVLAPLVTRLGYGRALVLLLGARGLALVPLAFVDSWVLAAVIITIAAFPDGAFFPIARTVQQRLIPAAVRGRVQGARAALGVAGWPLGSAMGGVLVAAMGAPAVAVVMAVGYLPLALAILVTPRLMRHTVRDTAPEHATRPPQPALTPPG